MPLVHLQRHILRPLLNKAALAFLESPQHHVVFLGVKAHREIVSVWLQVKKNTRALIELSGDQLETNANLPVVKVFKLFGDRIREVSEGFDIIYKLLVPRAINFTSLLGQSARRLPLLPLSPIHSHDLFPTVIDNHPVTDDGEKLGGLSTDLFFGDIHTHSLRAFRALHNCEGQYDEHDQSEQQKSASFHLFSSFIYELTTRQESWPAATDHRKSTQPLWDERPTDSR